MEDIKEIDIDRIVANRYQPRSHFDADSLFELAQSIRENGLIQPIVVRQVDDHYEIVAGERRFRASILAGKTTIQCVVSDYGDSASAQLALIENIQREDLNALEEAKAYQAIMKNLELTQEQLAKRVGKSQSSIANKIRLLNLPEKIQDGISGRQVSERHARALLGLRADKQLEIYQEVIAKKLNVAQTERLVETAKVDRKPGAPKQAIKGFSRNVQIAINTIQHAVKMVADTGIQMDVSQQDNDDEVILTLKIKK